jgi:ATP-dependent DNA helicase RecG
LCSVDSVVEFKAVGVHADAVAREMVTFANTQGGVILLGVSNNGDIEGLDDSKPWEEWVANISGHNIVLPIVTQYEETVVSGKRVGCVEVEKGKGQLSGTIYVSLQP